MLTIFTTLRPHPGTTIEQHQLNALRSWGLPFTQSLVLVEKDAPMEMGYFWRFVLCRALPIACLEPTEAGPPLLDGLFECGSKFSCGDLLCYSNADIMYTFALVEAAHIVRERFPRFLIVGRRTDVAMEGRAFDFSGDWQARLREFAAAHGRLHSPAGVDYFIYPRGFWSYIPSFYLARYSWDNWLVWAALEQEHAPVIDATDFILAVHQDHPLSGPPLTEQDPHVLHNLRLADGNLYNPLHGTHVLRADGEIVERGKG